MWQDFVTAIKEDRIDPIELKKALIAYDLDIKDENIVEQLFEYYWDTDNICYFINENIADYYFLNLQD